MVLTRVLAIEEAYRTVDWKVVFFLAGLIPLGIAMQKTGAAALLADEVMSPVQGSHPIILLLVISGMATVFSLFRIQRGATTSSSHRWSSAWPRSAGSIRALWCCW